MHNYCSKCNKKNMYQSDPIYGTGNYPMIKKSPMTCKKIQEVYQCSGQYVKIFDPGCTCK